MKKINSIEKNTAKGLYWIAGIFAGMTAFTLYKALINNAYSGIWIALAFLLGFSVLFYVLAIYHQNKFNKLGVTPLFIHQEKLHIGDDFSGKIQINKNQFNKVNKVYLNNMVYHTTDKITRYEKRLVIETDSHQQYDVDITWINFTFHIPLNGRPSMLNNRKRYYWEISIEYVENLSTVKRTWPIKVAPEKASYLTA